MTKAHPSAFLLFNKLATKSSLAYGMRNFDKISNIEDPKEIIFELENKLQQPDVRKSVEALKDLISDDLIEFGSSGRVYTKSDVLKNLPNAPEIKFTMTDFRINVLSPDIVQPLFKTEKTNLQTGEVTTSLRNSLWRNEN